MCRLWRWRPVECKSVRRQAKATVQEKQAFIKRLEESNLAREAEGRDAFNSLRRLRGEKLPPGDETIVARHLYDELPALKRHLRAKGMGIGEFCSRHNITDASESSKELHRLTLPAGKDPNAVRLRRAAGKYCLLIEAISKVTNESASSLADRVLMGTSLHPATQLGGLSEAEKLQTFPGLQPAMQMELTGGRWRGGFTITCLIPTCIFFLNWRHSISAGMSVRSGGSIPTFHQMVA